MVVRRIFRVRVHMGADAEAQFRILIENLALRYIVTKIGW